MSELKESWWARCWGMLKDKLQQLFNHPWRVCMIVGAAVIAAIIVAASIYVPNTAEAIVSVITLLIAVYGLYLLDRRMKATEQQTRVMTEQTKNMATQTENMTRQTANTTKQTENTTKQTANAAKQIAESRFAKAFEQIGNKNVAIQLGGLNLLDIIAKEGEDEYQRVWDYLASFLLYPPHPPPLDDGKDGGPVGLRPGIAEIAKMLRQGHERYPDHNAQLLNFSGAHFEGANLERARLSEADFIGVHFEGANLSEAELGQANLSGAELGQANLSRANLKGVRLYKAKLKKANLQAASFDQNSRLSRAIFDNTNVSSCDFSQVKDLNTEQLQGMVWVEGQQAPKLPEHMSQQTIRCITEEEWGKIQSVIQ